MATSVNKFMKKAIYNILRKYNGSSDGGFLLKKIYGCSDEIEMGVNWVRDYEILLNNYLEIIVDERDKKIAQDYVLPDKFCSVEQVHIMLDKMVDELSYLEEPFVHHINTHIIGDLLELTEIERLILSSSLFIDDINYKIEKIFTVISNDDRFKTTSNFYSGIFNVNNKIMSNTIKGFLFNGGLLLPHENIKCFHQITESLSTVIKDQGLTLEEIESKLFPNSIKTNLTIDDFSHLSKEIEITEKIISKSLSDKTQGTNILLWGIPGTGKTELALALAKKNGWDLKIVGDISRDDDKEKTRTERLASLKIAMKFYTNNKNTVILFDEMEDLFKSKGVDEIFSKSFINRIIETNSIPIIWTTNDLFCLGEALLRRMVYNIGFKVPPTSARKNIWKKCTDRHNIILDDKVIDDLGNIYDITPALINNAVKISSMTGLESERVPEILSSLDTLVNFGVERLFKGVSTRKDTPYDISVINSSTNVVLLTEQLKKTKPNFSLCLYGPPGTGKSEFSRHLAEILGKQVIYKRVSDLQSMYVGVCEQNIAEAFKESAREHKVLIIDEGDSFLRDRASAVRSWEVSQVNEMLSQMEVAKEPFIITTNLVEGLDPASLRRFTFKIKFDFLKPKDSQKLFRQYFNCESPVAILNNDILTPGDFATVKRKSDILNIFDPKELLDLLNEECDLKQQKRKEFGFKSNR